MTAATSAPSRTDGATSGASGDGALSHKQIMTILSGLMLGMFLAALDQTIVATAIKTIGNDLDGLSIQAWVTTAFLITSTITTPLYGKLSDLYGRKRLFMIAITIFILGSALCGLAQSMYMLAAFRAFQGLGAGGLMSLALAIIGDIIPPRERAKYQGYFMAVFATSSVLGPVLGGLLSGQKSILGFAGWRMIFYINVPIGIVALVVVQAVLKLDHNPMKRRIDWYGAAAMVVGLVPLLLIAEQGRTWGWASGGAFACYFVGLAGIVGFVWIEDRMGEDALIPLRLFRSGVFSLGSAQSALIGMAMFGGLAAIPLYLQIVKGASPTKSGLLLLPMVGGIMVASMAAGQVTARTGRYKIFPIVGSLAMIAGLLLMTRVDASTPLWQTDVYMALFGAGLGLNMQTIVLAMQNAVPARDMGVSTASATFFRQIGATLGTAVFLSILFTSAGTKIKSAYGAAEQTSAFRAAAAAHPDQLKAITGSGTLNDTSVLNGVTSVLKAPFLNGFSGAMDLVFLVGGLLLIIPFVLSLLMKEVPLRSMSGQQARAAESGQAAGSAAPVDAPQLATVSTAGGESSPSASTASSGSTVGTASSASTVTTAAPMGSGTPVTAGAGAGRHEASGAHEASVLTALAGDHPGTPRHLSGGGPSAGD